MNKSTINIGLACGGTGGHISPALALASNFKNHNIKPVFITDVRGSSLLKSMSHYVVLSGSPSSKGFTKVINMLKIFFGILQSTYYLYRTKVNLVIGFGGYTSVPIILAAKILNIPSIIHEQNKILGRANKFCSLFCNKVALSFNLKENVKNPKFVLTGNPVSRDFENLQYSRSNIDKSKFVLLIIGGSQGASVFSEVVPKAIKSLPEKIKNKIYIYQQCRKNEERDLKKIYKKLGIKFTVSNYFHKIYEIFKKADLIISRSGGSTITEIIASGKPSFLIPLPNSLDNHQRENAYELKNNNACILFEQKDFSEKSLSEKLNMVLSNKSFLREMSINAKSIYKKDAAKNLIDLILLTRRELINE